MPPSPPWPPSWPQAPSTRGRAGALRRSGEYRRTVKDGNRVAGRAVVLYVLPGEQGLRAGFVCGRAVGGAVRRNRARRVLKEAWRAVAPRVRGGFDVVFVARPQIQGAKTQDVVEDVERALGAAGVIES